MLSTLAAAGGSAALSGAANAETTPDDPHWKITNGRINQSVVAWCFRPMAVEELARSAAALGLTAADRWLGRGPRHVGRAIRSGAVIDHDATVDGRGRRRCRRRRRRIVLDPQSDPGGVEIVGVLRDFKQNALAQEIEPQMFVPYAQVSGQSLAVVVRTKSDPAALTPAAAAQVRELDPDLPVYAVRTMEEVLAASSAQPKFYMLLLAGFAFFVSLVFAVLAKDHPGEQLRFGGLLFVGFVGAAIVIGWLMFPFPL